MDPLYKKKRYTFRQRCGLTEQFLDISQQDENFQRRNRQLEALEDRYWAFHTSMSEEDQEMLTEYYRAITALGDSTAAIAYHMGRADGKRHTLRLLLRLLK